MRLYNAGYPMRIPDFCGIAFFFSRTSRMLFLNMAFASSSDTSAGSPADSPVQETVHEDVYQPPVRNIIPRNRRLFVPGSGIVYDAWMRI
jgi:hypothetical protein